MWGTNTIDEKTIYEKSFQKIELKKSSSINKVGICKEVIEESIGKEFSDNISQSVETVSVDSRTKKYTDSEFKEDIYAR